MSREIPRKVVTLFEKTGLYGRCVLSPGHFVVEFAAAYQRQSASPRKTHKCALHSQLILSYLRRVAHTNP